MQVAFSSIPYFNQQYTMFFSDIPLLFIFFECTVRHHLISFFFISCLSFPLLQIFITKNPRDYNSWVFCVQLDINLILPSCIISNEINSINILLILFVIDFTNYIITNISIIISF